MSNKMFGWEKLISDVRFITAVLFIPLLISPKGLEELFLIDALVWGIAAFVSDRKGFEHVLGDRLLWINLCYPVILFLSVTIVNGFFIKHSILLPIMIFYFLYYYQKKFKTIECRLGLGASIAYLLLIHIYTLFMLKQDPNISRLLASSAYGARYGNVWTGGYGHTYVTMLICIIVFAMILRCKNVAWRFIMIFVEAFSVLFLMKAGYTMALLFAAGGILLVILFEIGSKRKGAAVILMGVILLPGILLVAGKGLNLLATIITNVYAQKRLQEVANLLQFNGIKSNGDLVGRFGLYKLSAETFIKSPLVGVGNGTLYRKALYGGHSTFLDNLACFGLLGGGTYIGLILYNLGNLCGRIEKDSRYIYISAFAAYILLSVVNVSDVVAIYAAVFLLIPMMICVYSDRRREKNEYFNDL